MLIKGKAKTVFGSIILSWAFALALVPISTNAEPPHSRFKFDRYEQVTCGARVVDFLSAIEVFVPIQKSLEGDVRRIRLVFPNIPTETTGFLSYDLLVDKSFERKGGRPAVIYPAGIFGNDIHVETHRVFCDGDDCQIVLQFYPHYMMPEGEYVEPVLVKVSLHDAADQSLWEVERALTIPDPMTGFIPNHRFEEFNLMLETSRAIIEPASGYAERVSAFRVQIADARGWQEIELLDYPTGNGFWVVPYEGELTYFGVLAVDKTGVWENKVELVDLQRDWPIKQFEGQCRR